MWAKTTVYRVVPSAIFVGMLFVSPCVSPVSSPREPRRHQTTQRMAPIVVVAGKEEEEEKKNKLLLYGEEEEEREIIYK